MAHPPRLKNFPYVGKHRYFLTFCTDDRKPLFRDRRVAEMLRDQIARTSSDAHVAVIVYCTMEDHVHLLARGTEEDSDLRAFMKELKQQTGWWYRRERKARLWQVSYYDRVLRPEEGTASVLAYIVKNPVRAGLVAEPLQYEFWGSFTHSREGIVDLIEGAADWQPGDP